MLKTILEKKDHHIILYLDKYILMRHYFDLNVERLIDLCKLSLHQKADISRSGVSLIKTESNGS